MNYIFRKIFAVVIFVCLAGGMYAQIYVPTDLRGDTINIIATRLNINLSNYNSHVLHGDAVIGIKAQMDNVQDIRLDLLKLTVDSVKVNGATISNFNYNDTVIGIPFASAMNTNDSSTVEVFYHGTPLQVTMDFGGFYWNGPYAFNIGVSFLFNPPNFGKVWFPCFDNFTVKSYMEYYVTTPVGKKAFCNGLLLDETGDSIWHWKLAEKIPSYLASMSVADYQTLADTVQGINGTTPILLAARASDTAALTRLFVHLHNAFHIHEGHWGAYPWERVGYCIVEFGSGAMEHATNISVMEPYLYPPYSTNGSTELMMAHELSHHWFGDLVTCRDAAEMWLNESWAVYNQDLFLQSMYGDSTYHRAVLNNHEYVLDQVFGADGGYLPVSNVPFKNTYGATVYEKGPDMIRTLRYYMGDSLFFNGVQAYLHQYAYSTANTTDMLNALTQYSGMDLTDYFSDWIMNPGFTHLSIERNQTLPSGNGFISEMVIRQRLKEAPAYFTNVPVTVSYFDSVGDRTDEIVNVSGECSSHTSAVLPFSPAYIAIDFDDNLADARTTEWSRAVASDSFTFGTEFMNAKVNAATGYNLLRVEHNWVRPEPMADKIPGLHLNQMHYWNVDGIMQPGFNASGYFSYNGTDVSLDAGFITNSEDSIVMMYRSNADSEWAFADSFVVNTGGSATDGFGSVTVFGVKRGQYAFAIWNSAEAADTTSPDAPCIFVASSAVTDLSAEKNDFRLFPNPANETVSIQFNANAYVKAELFDQLGRKIQGQQIAPLQTTIEMKLNNIAPGYYSVTLSNKQGIRTSKKLIKE